MAKNKNILNSLLQKKKFSIWQQNPDEEIWHTHISTMSIITFIIGLLFIVFFLSLILVAYTPVLDLLPGYRTDAVRGRDKLIKSIIRVDSLERKLSEMLAYNESMILVVEGKTPSLRTPIVDSLSRDKSLVPRSLEDSLLRAKIEGNGDYAISEAVRQNVASRNKMNAVRPSNGVVSERFNARVGLYGVRLATAPETQIVAISDGVVISCDWAPEIGNCVMVQHPNGILSVYRHVYGVLVSKGQNVRSNEVIGYTSSSNVPNSESILFEFELWEDGKPIDPETYILF